MKRNAYIILMALVMVILCGCGGRMEEMNSLEKDANDRVSMMKDSVKECVNNCDADGIVNLFSKSVRNDIDDLNDRAIELIKLFEGDSIKSLGDANPYISGAEYAQPMEISDIYDVELESGKHYTMAIWIIAIDDEHPEDVGVQQIEILNCCPEDAPEGFEWSEMNSENRGLHIFAF